MSSKRSLLPALLALPFAVVVATDVYRVLARQSRPDVSLLESVGSLEFEPTAGVADLRRQPPTVVGADSRWEVTLGDGWGLLGRQGRWSQGARFEVDWTVPVGGQTALFIEARVDRNEGRGSSLAVAVNGRDTGEVELSRAIRKHTLLLSSTPFYPGDNRLQFRLVDPRTGADDISRTALIRRLAVAQDESRGFPETPAGAPFRVAADGTRVVIRLEGRLILPFEVPASGTVLEFRYRFRIPGSGAQARVVVARRYSGSNRYDVARSVTLHADERQAGRVRHVLRDRSETNALVVWVNAAAARSEFVIIEPRIAARPNRR